MALFIAEKPIFSVCKAQKELIYVNDLIFAVSKDNSIILEGIDSNMNYA